MLEGVQGVGWGRFWGLDDVEGLGFGNWALKPCVACVWGVGLLGVDRVLGPGCSYLTIQRVYRAWESGLREHI